MGIRENYSQVVFVGFWVLVFFEMAFAQIPGGGVVIWKAFIGIIISILLLIGISLSIIYYLLPIFKEGNRLFSVSCLMGLLVISHFIIFYIEDWAYEGNLNEEPFYLWATAVIPFNLFFTATSVLLHQYNGAWVEAVREKAEQKASMELDLLKAQINPHFLFNTLNNIYYYASTQHPDTPDMIERLSNILRYIVYEGKIEQISLKKEIACLEDLFSLYKMKDEEQEAITFEHSDFNGDLQIAPLILLNLLENAFKHSDALRNKNGFIWIKAKVDDADTLHFNISNSVEKNGSTKNKNGVGQENIQKQLDLLYRQRHSLETTLKDNIFNLKLTIQLDRKD